ncbi:hypothetical protein BC938DRAFT_481642 [Jimgerdemannia flammicorona]|uniref:Riboflavin kinase n=1 Tax=Jimgerdemannia flammicorona TaxID=994334 RepID=A0A433QFR2_9FUNG|nr:hypothetical protein BC938DRAFT_481642 [Jimgerdemannia flammicorona]
MAATQPPKLNPNRRLLIGPDTPEAPFPIRLNGQVVKGFGRGSKELGIPTVEEHSGFTTPFLWYGHPISNLTTPPLSLPANLSNDALETLTRTLDIGVYYGWAQIGNDPTVYPMVMSLGWNPYYKNEKRSAEVHLIHTFSQDFYGECLRVLVLGYIRPEQNYPSLDALIDDINTDIECAKVCLARPAYEVVSRDELFKGAEKREV